VFESEISQGQLWLRRVIRPISIRDAVFWVDGDFDDFLRGGQRHIVRSLLHPGFSGQFDLQVSTVLVPDLHPHRQNELTVLLNGYVRSLGRVSRIVVLHVLRNHVHGPVVLIPTAPEVAQVFAAFALHLTEKIRWCRMFEGPVVNVFTEGAIEDLVAHDLFAQQIETLC